MTVLPPFLIRRSYRIIRRREIARDIIELRLAPMSTAIPAPVAGQWVYLEVSHPDGTPWARSAYSIANAAVDVIETGVIELAIKRAGAFTSRVFELREGESVNLQGPFGVFTFDQTASHSVFLAGGIGITPLRSMILEALKGNAGGQLLLIYSCRAQEELAYIEELQALAAQSDRFRFLPICTREEESSPWGGLRGHITSEILDREIPAFDGAMCYLCGPLNFMEAMKQILEEKNVPKNHIRMERFT